MTLPLQGRGPALVNRLLVHFGFLLHELWRINLSVQETSAAAVSVIPITTRDTQRRIKMLRSRRARIIMTLATGREVLALG